VSGSAARSLYSIDPISECRAVFLRLAQDVHSFELAVACDGWYSDLVPVERHSDNGEGWPDLHESRKHGTLNRQEKHKLRTSARLGGSVAQ
jgi:hypothetical protein